MISLVAYAVFLLDVRAVDDAGDIKAVTARLRGALDNVRGKLRISDALLLAGFPRRSFHRLKIVGRVMRQLGWERGRCRFNGALTYVYARGSTLEREIVLDVERGEEGQLVIKRREP
jgi:hypothetical protein